MSRRHLSRDLSLSGDVISAWLMSAAPDEFTLVVGGEVFQVRRVG